MDVILSDRKLDNQMFPQNVEIVLTTYKTLDKYDNNPNVLAIVGSRAMAIKAEKMNLKGLKLFQLTSAGFDGVPCERYAARKVKVANAGNVYSIPIAETVIFGMLSMAKKLHENPNNRHCKIQRNYYTITELAGKSVLIMGTGSIGTEVAKRLAGFEMIIDGYNRSGTYSPQYRKILNNYDELMAGIGKYDYFVSTLPDNEQTKGLLKSELFSAMKKTAVVINVGRRTVFDEEDFYIALKNGIIGGAVLDMFEKMPNPIQNKFRRLHNVIVLPGVAAISQEVNERLKQHITQNLLRIINGSEVSNVINAVIVS